MGRRSPGTVAAHSGSAESKDHSVLSTQHGLNHSYPLTALTTLSQAEKEHLLTRAAIAYRDPQLSDPIEVIVRRQQQEQQASSLEPTSGCRKRWLLGTQSRDFMGTSF